MSCFGAVAGGIRKTEDAGVTWTNVSDGYLKTASVGALAVSDSEPGTIRADMGESSIRTDVSHDDGVYGSTDRGRTWVHAGTPKKGRTGESQRPLLLIDGRIRAELTSRNGAG